MHAPASLSDGAFVGSIPNVYETLLVPMLFAPYAADLAERVALLSPRTVLELAAGTGAVTRELARRLDATTAIVATDFNPAMLDQAQARGTARTVTWQAADAGQLPFGDETYDVVVCQFGVMFFPDKAAAFREARRVLRPGGHFLFNVWDRLAENELSDAVVGALEAVFPQDPPRFAARVPHGYFEERIIEADLREAGFTAAPAIVSLAKRSTASSAAEAARALCQGTPMRNEIEQRAPGRLDEVTARVTEALAQRYAGRAVDGKLQALVVSVARDPA